MSLEDHMERTNDLLVQIADAVNFDEYTHQWMRNEPGLWCCNHCLFYIKDECHRRPPNHTGVWPKTDSTDKCGEFECGTNFP